MCLGLTLTDEEYTTIPNTQHFDSPMHLPPLDTPSIATLVQALKLKGNHAKANNGCLECKNIEKVMLRHVQDAIE